MRPGTLCVLGALSTEARESYRCASVRGVLPLRTPGGAGRDGYRGCGGRVRELGRQRGIDPVEQPAVVARLVDEVIADYEVRSISGALAPLPNTRSAAGAVFDAVSFGPWQP